MTTMLDTIFDRKRERVEESKRELDPDRIAVDARHIRDGVRRHVFRNSFSDVDRINVIAEFKRASPSKGIINDSLDAAEAARSYQAGGAVAISVLTEEDHFRGSLDDLRAIRRAVDLPILRKDFMLDEFQIYESAIAGADAILLLASYLTADEMRRFRSLAEDELGLDTLVEVRTLDEIKIAADIGATLIGVNNRDLRTFEVSLDVSRELIRHAPSGATLIAESGLRSREDLIELRSRGYAGFLIGETLMRSDDAATELRSLVSSF